MLNTCLKRLSESLGFPFADLYPAPSFPNLIWVHEWFQPPLSLWTCNWLEGVPWLGSVSSCWPSDAGVAAGQWSEQGPWLRVVSQRSVWASDLQNWRSKWRSAPQGCDETADTGGSLGSSWNLGPVHLKWCFVADKITVIVQLTQP